MRKIKVITDSCADLSPDLLRKYDIDYARMSTVLDGKQSPAQLDWTEAEVKAFYNTMRDGKRITTAQVSIDEFMRIFTKYLDEGCDIIYIACSVKQSGSVNTGHVTAQKLLENYPGAKISCINSLNACMGEGILAIEAAKMAAEGLPFEEVESKIKGMLKQVNEYCAVHTLEYLRRAGRVKAAASFFGNLMGIKPIIIADANGDQTPVKKVKGRRKSLEEIVSMMAQTIVNPQEQTLYLTHADCAKEEVDSLIELIHEKIPCKDIHVGFIGPIIGASIGPEAIALHALGQPVTFTAEE